MAISRVTRRYTKGDMLDSSNNSNNHSNTQTNTKSGFLSSSKSNMEWEWDTRRPQVLATDSSLLRLPQE